MMKQNTKNFGIYFFIVPKAFVKQYDILRFNYCYPPKTPNCFFKEKMKTCCNFFIIVSSVKMSQILQGFYFFGLGFHHSSECSIYHLTVISKPLSKPTKGCQSSALCINDESIA